MAANSLSLLVQENEVPCESVSLDMDPAHTMSVRSSASMLGTASTRPSLQSAAGPPIQQVQYATPSAAPLPLPQTSLGHLPLDLITSAYAPFMLPNHHSLAPCLLSSQMGLFQPLVCQSCMYASAAQPCMHHAPIAYGQATSSYQAVQLANNNSQQEQLQHHHQQQSNGIQTVTNQQVPSTQQIQNVSLSVAQHQQTIQNSLPGNMSLPVAPSSLPPTLPQSMRSVTMRLKRTNPGRGMDRGTKLRRVASSGNAVGMISEVQSPAVEQPPSTSQLPTLTPCNCAIMNRGPCSQCAPCQCPFCPLDPLQCSHMIQHQQNTTPTQPPVQQITRDVREVQEHHAALRLRAAQDAFWSQQLAALDHHNRQLVGTPVSLRPFPLPGSTSLYVLPRSGISGTTHGRMIELNMLFNVMPGDIVGMAGDHSIRPLLERHHMFGNPGHDPQPIGATLDDIEKNTCKSEFIKDFEIPEEEQGRCTVCLNDFETGEGVRTLKCTHLFHVDCIDKWLTYNKKCPVCRLDVDNEKKVATLVE